MFLNYICTINRSASVILVYDVFMKDTSNGCVHYFLLVAGILERGIQIEGLGNRNFLTYESNVLFALRFMIDCNIVGGNWIELPVGKYKKASKIISSCQLELECLYPHVLCISFISIFTEKLFFLKGFLI